jgi:hypothetical protein
LSKGSSGNINKVETGSRVTLQIAVQLPQVHDVIDREEASFSPGSIEDRSSMSLGQYETI